MLIFEIQDGSRLSGVRTTAWALLKLRLTADTYPTRVVHSLLDMSLELRAGDSVWTWGPGFEEMEGIEGMGENAKEFKSRVLIRLLVLPLAGL